MKTKKTVKVKMFWLLLTIIALSSCLKEPPVTAAAATATAQVVESLFSVSMLYTPSADEIIVHGYISHNDPSRTLLAASYVPTDYVGTQSLLITCELTGISGVDVEMTLNRTDPETTELFAIFTDPDAEEQFLTYQVKTMHLVPGSEVWE